MDLSRPIVPYLLTLLVLLATYLIIKLARFLNRQRHIWKIVSPKGGLPFFGHMFTMLKGSPWDTMANWAKQYGGIFRVTLFGSDVIVVSDSSLLIEIMQRKMPVFDKDLSWTYDPFLVILGNGLVTSLIHTLRIDVLEDVPLMSLRAVERISKKFDDCCKTNATIDVSEEFRHLTLQVIAEVILSIAAEESDRTFATMYLPIVEEANNRVWSPERAFFPSPSWFKFRRDVKKLNDYVVGLITNRWALMDSDKNISRRRDVLDKVLSALDPAARDEQTIMQVRDEVKTFILAGHETSASMLTWTLYELTQNPHVLQKLLAEAEDVYGSLSAEDLAGPNKAMFDKLVYAECCLRETLRKYSVVPSVVRVNNEDVTLGGYHVAAGSTWILNIQGTHHTEEYWPEPSKYIPERFLETPKPFTFVPFIDGPRNCLGQYLSILESKIVLSSLVRKYRFEVTNADASEKHPFMVPIIPKSGHVMKVSLR